MELFWKAAAAALIGVILILTVGKGAKEIGLLLCIGICCMILMAAMEYLSPVLDYLWELETGIFLDGNLLKTLFKLVGIGIISEITAIICTDAGCSALGKGLQMLASAVILFLSLPFFKTVVSVIQDIMGGI